MTIAAALVALAWRGDIRSAAQTGVLAAWSPDAAQPIAASHSGVVKRAPMSVNVVAAGVSDPLGGAPDLQHIYDQYIASADPRQRSIAVRAFEACVPAFLPAAGQTPSPEPLIAALPPERRAEREAALRTLFARCHRFLTEDRAALDALRQALQRDPLNEAAGLRAQQALLAGDHDLVESTVSAALASADPLAVESLAGLAVRIAQARESEATQSEDAMDAALLQRASAVDAALHWVACDLGLDCRAESLWALQVCAVEGQCEGDLEARLMARLIPGAVDTVAVQQQRARLLDLIRSGRPLGTADLLP